MNDLLKEFDEKYPISIDYPYLCEHRTEWMSYAISNWASQMSNRNPSKSMKGGAVENKPLS